LLRDAGWAVNRKRVERIWRREGLKVPQRQPKRSRLWLADGSCIRLRPDRANHVWAYDFVEDRPREGRKFRMLCVVDDYTREALAIRVARKLLPAFGRGICADLAAVKAALTEAWSNGQTEGNITRLLLLRRQMYGRGKLDLLRARLIAHA
jgi:hypothetical protein